MVCVLIINKSDFERLILLNIPYFKGLFIAKHNLSIPLTEFFLYIHTYTSFGFSKNENTKNLHSQVTFFFTKKKMLFVSVTDINVGNGISTLSSNLKQGCYVSLCTNMLGKIAGQTDSLALVRQWKWKTKFKPAVLCLKIDLVSCLAHVRRVG